MSVITLAVALGVSGVIGLIAWKGHESLRELQRNLAIEAFFDPSVSSDDANAIANSQIAKIDGVAQIAVISKEQALADYKASSGENIESVLGLNPLPASARIYLRDASSSSVKRIQAALRSINGVSDVRSNEALLQTTESRAHTLDMLALIIGGCLVLSATLYFANSVRLLLALREKSIHSLSLMGASRWQMAGPFILENFLGGLLGGFVSALFVLVLVRAAFSQFAIEVSTKHLLAFGVGLLASGAIIGLVASSLVSALRVRRF